MRAVAEEVGGHIWADTGGAAADDGHELTEEQRDAIRQLAAPLPEGLARPFRALLGEDDDGSAGVPMPA